MNSIGSGSSRSMKMKKVHPVGVGVGRKRNMSEGNNKIKKLRRLPHVFSRVLELPFCSDADVSVQEAPDCFRFVAETEEEEEDIGNVEAHTVEIHPGVTKIVVRVGGSSTISLDELDLDIWRFRLPDSTRPDLATAVFLHGELIVTVPKDEDVWNADDENNRGTTMGGGAGGTLVLVHS